MDSWFEEKRFPDILLNQPDILDAHIRKSIPPRPGLETEMAVKVTSIGKDQEYSQGGNRTAAPEQPHSIENFRHAGILEILKFFQVHLQSGALNNCKYEINSSNTPVFLPLPLFHDLSTPTPIFPKDPP
jgi:hypothetical protein